MRARDSRPGASLDLREGISPIVGRVFLVGGTNGVSLRDAESGEVLFDLPDHQRFTWLDAQTGIAIKRSQPAAIIPLISDT